MQRKEQQKTHHHSYKWALHSGASESTTSAFIPILIEIQANDLRNSFGCIIYVCPHASAQSFRFQVLLGAERDREKLEEPNPLCETKT